MIARTSKTTGEAPASWNAVTWARQPAWPKAARASAWTAVAAAVAVLVWMGASGPPQIQEAEAVADAVVPRQMKMYAPALVGRLGDGRAYRILADSAQLTPGAEDRARLSGVKALVQLDDGSTLDISAAQGDVDRTRRLMSLRGDVVANRSDGYRLETPAIDMMDAAGGLTANSDAPVRISGPDGVATASGAVAEPGLQRIRLKGPVAIRMNERPAN